MKPFYRRNGGCNIDSKEYIPQVRYPPKRHPHMDMVLQGCSIQPHAAQSCACEPPEKDLNSDIHLFPSAHIEDTHAPN